MGFSVGQMHDELTAASRRGRAARPRHTSKSTVARIPIGEMDGMRSEGGDGEKGPLSPPPPLS